jgi:hypothetical protein
MRTYSAWVLAYSSGPPSSTQDTNMSRHAEDTPGLKPNTVSAVSPAHVHVHELHHCNAALMTKLWRIVAPRCQHWMLTARTHLADAIQAACCVKSLCSGQQLSECGLLSCQLSNLELSGDGKHSSTR